MTLTLPQENVRFPKAQGFGARLDSLYLRLAPNQNEPLRVYTRDLLAERRDDEGIFYENVLDLGFVWARTDWSGGEGLDWDPSDSVLTDPGRSLTSTRFWDSKFLDVSIAEPGIPNTLDVTKGFQAWTGALSSISVMAAATSELSIAAGQVIRWYESWTNTTPLGSDDIGTDVFHMDVAPNGSTMASGADGKLYYRRFDAAVFTEVLDPLTASRPQVAGIWYAKGRFMVGLSDTTIAELLEVTPAADGLSVTEVIVDTAPGVFYSVIDSGPAVVAAVSDGTVRTYTPFLDSNDPAAVGQLIPRGRTDMPTGERPYLLGDAQGILVILTLSIGITSADNEVRCYTSEVLDARFDYSVGNIQSKRTWRETSETPGSNQRMITARNEVFFKMDENIAPAVDEEYLWRFDSATTGLSRHRLNGIDGDDRSLSMVRFKDQIGGVTAFDDVYFDDTLFVDDGYIITPNITFGLNTDTNWLAIVVEGRGISDGAKIEAYRSTDPEAILDPDHASWVLMARLTSDSQSGTEQVISNVKSRTLTVMVRVFANDANTATAELTRFAIRGLPTHRDLIVDLPVNISDLIEVPGRQPVRIPNWGNNIHTFLLNLKGAHVELQLYDPPLLFLGVIDNLLEPTTWISPRGSSVERLTLQFRGNLITEGGTTNVTGNSMTGLGMTGRTTTGLGAVGPP